MLNFADGCHVVLASSSPRRKELLAQLGLKFEVVAANIDEESFSFNSPAETVCGLAKLKGEAVAAQYPDYYVIAADTIVVLDGEILGKPRDRSHAVEMISKLRSRTHQVWGGAGITCLSQGVSEFWSSVTEVTFGEVSDELVHAYTSTEEPYDKAGGYGAQGRAQAFVECVKGSYSNVVGLDMALLMKKMISQKMIVF